MYRTILLALDSAQLDTHEPAVAAAVAAARQSGAKLHLMTVVPDFGMSIVGMYFPEGYEHQALDAARERLHDLAEHQVPDDLTVDVHVRHGRPYEEILAGASSVNADLIVIGSHEPGMEDYLLGSTASRVVRFARCSVLVVRAHDDAG